MYNIHLLKFYKNSLLKSPSNVKVITLYMIRESIHARFYIFGNTF
jgi:hypothetical protein